LLKYFLPNFEDLVDPEYDFIHDQHSPHHKDRLIHDRFAHDFFDTPIFDGMLVSKASLTKSVEKIILEAGGIHKFTRLEPSIMTMADCGAFTYRFEENPIYSTQQVIDYYQALGFNFGVSLDHLAFVTVESLESAHAQGLVKRKWWEGKTTEQIQSERFELTLQNAQRFLDLYTSQKPQFVPVGIAQGGSADLYYYAVERLIKMGYEHIALGGMIRHSDEEIVVVLEKLKSLVNNGIELHIFGIGRISLVPKLISMGVTSIDSASPLRRAFLGAGEDNYWAVDGQRYAAIRVPEARTNRRKRGLDHPNEIILNGDRPVDSVAELSNLEQNALKALRAYDREELDLEDTLNAVLRYDRLFGEKRDHHAWYRRTLTDKPWKRCDCPICRTLGIEVMIFRGNNRNRRRGFHNVKVFYDQLQHLLRSYS
jgi:hypothetical protein